MIFDVLDNSPTFFFLLLDEEFVDIDESDARSFPGMFFLDSSRFGFSKLLSLSEVSVEDARSEIPRAFIALPRRLELSNHPRNPLNFQRK